VFSGQLAGFYFVVEEKKIIYAGSENYSPHEVKEK